MRLATTEVGLQLHDRVASISGKPLQRVGEQLL
jgi:hypothetical protein